MFHPFESVSHLDSSSCLLTITHPPSHHKALKAAWICTVPVLTVSLEESATCCTASWAACTGNTSQRLSWLQLIVKTLSEWLHLYMWKTILKVYESWKIKWSSQRQIDPLFSSTCTVCDSFRGRVARAFQALKRLLERGHGSCLCPCCGHTSVWTDSGGSGCLIPFLSPTPASLHVPDGLTRTKPT